MKLKLICVGDRMPIWVQQGTDEYAKRIQRELGFSLVEVPIARRSKALSVEKCLDKEAADLLAKIGPNDYVVALEVTGKAFTTEGFAAEIERLRDQGQNLCLLIGGPDGLAERILQRANGKWSLSRMTLPHPLARVLLVEQLYRAASILKGHPYHRV
ncbi:MAG: 23S rRNA (pseudouridine(1915)-N(3))-methyltransferase RlmH [Pseudomonadales bacterium]|nr:23S rRNA (pseudouridine(1915)-N(3))-methyltransferase RlmH [Pseudomonadales bacterium]